MITVMKWTERLFNFDLPLGVYPCLLERLRGTPPRLAELVDSIPRDSLTAIPSEGWSIQEHIGHLIDVERLHDVRIDDYLARKDELTPADLSGRKTNEANYNEKPIGDILARFRNARLELVSRLERLDAPIVARPSHHSRLDVPMRPIDMAFFVAEHDDHHIALIRQMMASG